MLLAGGVSQATDLTVQHLSSQGLSIADTVVGHAQVHVEGGQALARAVKSNHSLVSLNL